MEGGGVGGWGVGGGRWDKSHEYKIEITSFPLKVSQIISHVLKKKKISTPYFLNSQISHLLLNQDKYIVSVCRPLVVTVS